MTDRPNPIVIHGLSIIAIFFLTVFAWNILEFARVGIFLVIPVFERGLCVDG